jgi:dTDP-4-amino-4,6-dideoxygalactose transaminase
MGVFDMPKLAIAGGEPIRKGGWNIPWPQQAGRELELLKEVVNSTHWGTRGPKVVEFEERFANAHGCKYGVAVTSGTVALQLALEAVGVEPGDEVIIPPYTFVATATCAVKIGAVPVFADIEPDTYNIDASSVEAHITERTKAIIPVHIGGRPADMDAVMDVAKRHNLRVIEDCAQAHTASWRGKPVGSIGDAGCFSFQNSKNISAGEGGIIITNDESVYTTAWSLHNVGRRPGGEWYEHPIMGGNYRMTEWQAAVLLAQLERMEEWAQKREHNANQLRRLLSGVDGVLLPKDDERVTRNAYHLFIFRLELSKFGGVTKHQVAKAVQSEGIPLSPGYSRPLYRELVFLEYLPKYFEKLLGRKVDYSSVHLPVTEEVVETAVWLPQWVLLAEEKDMEDIAKAIDKVRTHAEELKSAC